jgi:hypothetical protein
MSELWKELFGKCSIYLRSVWFIFPSPTSQTLLCIKLKLGLKFTIQKYLISKVVLYTSVKLRTSI